MDKIIGLIVELGSVKTITVYWHEELLNEVKQRHAEEFRVWKETSAENADSLISNIKVVKADCVKMSVEIN